jgi:hypothetical protein
MPTEPDSSNATRDMLRSYFQATEVLYTTIQTALDTFQAAMLEVETAFLASLLPDTEDGQ